MFELPLMLRLQGTPRKDLPAGGHRTACLQFLRWGVDLPTPRKSMGLFRILSLSLLSMPLWAFTAVHARPFLYVSSFTHGGSARECLEGARAALERSGFTRDLAIDYFDDQSIGGHVGGMLRDAAVVAKIECDQSIGVTALAVSGLDNELTYQKYRQLFEAKW